MTNQLKTILLLGALTALLVSAGGLLGEGYLAVFGGLAVLIRRSPSACGV